MFDLKEQLKKLPEKPGVYLMKDKSGEIIYVGKAISLKNRVRQYFQSAKHHPPKVRAMVGNIAEFEYILTDSEVEALILEANLIKKHQPKYNVLLRDDKQYPYIKVTLGEKYPRVFKTRRFIKDGSRYFGPFIHVGAINHIIEMLQKFYPLRTCNKNLQKNKDRACLNYHIGKCLGPCQGAIQHEDYMKMIDEIILFLSGKHEDFIKKIEEKMQQAAASMNFEKAAAYRDFIHGIYSITQKQKMVLPADMDQDLIAMARGVEDVCVMVFFIRGGKLIGREHYMLTVREDEERGEILSAFMKQFYAEAAFVPKEILLEETINDFDVIEQWLSVKKGAKVALKIPQRGDKKALLDLVHKNAVETLSKFRDKLLKDQQKSEGAIKALGECLGFSKPPFRIESFDISNTQGVDSVASMVVFENGKPKYSDYRRFKMKTQGPNDYASMQEVIYRRFKRGIEEKEHIKEKGIADEEGKFSKFPDLILIDGGIGQVNAAQEVLNALGICIPIGGMVKDDRHKTKDLVYDGKLLHIQKNPLLFQFIGKIQEETHRFAIAYHKRLRGKTAIQSILEEIPGIGQKRRVALLKHFQTIEKIKKASIEELSQVKGMNKKAAKEIKDYFSKKNTTKE